MRLFLSLMLASLMLLGCGQKGVLYKSPDLPENQPQAEQTEQPQQSTEEN
ncbi:MULTISPECIES: LPS translocon maturation chaperone LptM [Shewanella]|nr:MULTISPECIES: lipoprotein [Shewanella]MCA0950005.1 lipoprotein [Shewanella chilikensis]MCL1154170.1 lipoprotein [Shewanella chilikensis]MCL1162156.1 lipoprotein [Shewanella chilikensis]